LGFTCQPQDPLSLERPRKLRKISPEPVVDHHIPNRPEDGTARMVVEIGPPAAGPLILPSHSVDGNKPAAAAMRPSPPPKQVVMMEISSPGLRIYHQALNAFTSTVLRLNVESRLDKSRLSSMINAWEKYGSKHGLDFSVGTMRTLLAQILHLPYGEDAPTCHGAVPADPNAPALDHQLTSHGLGALPFHLAKVSLG